MPIAKAALMKMVAYSGAGLVVAGSAGFVMQQHGQPAAAAAPPPAVAVAAVTPAVPPAEATPLALSEIELTSSPVVPPVSDPASPEFEAVVDIDTPANSGPVADTPGPAEVLLAQAEAQPGADVPADAPDEGAVADCEVTLTAEAQAAAMVDLTLDAPCYAGERVAIHHEGMVFSDLTDAEGQLSVSVPALAEFAIFVAVFQDGEGSSADTQVSSLAFYDRSVLQWQGDTGLELHALEYGASYDAPGHVWAGAPRDVSVAATGEGGFLTLLGNADLPQARMAQVYSFPMGIAKTPGDIDLSVEVQVTEDNCGRDVSGQVIHVAEAEFGSFHDLNVTMPACDAAGDYLLLKNLLGDLKIAAN